VNVWVLMIPILVTTFGLLVWRDNVDKRRHAVVGQKGAMERLGETLKALHADRDLLKAQTIQQATQVAKLQAEIAQANATVADWCEHYEAAVRLGVAEHLPADLQRLEAERDHWKAWGYQRDSVAVMFSAKHNSAMVEARRWHGAYRSKVEELQAIEAKATAEPDGPFRRLLALIVKELHPDHAPPESGDRALRAEVFKAIWPKIQALKDAV
jgi:hypothetical protein